MTKIISFASDFGIGFYVYGESVAVPCAVVESEKENRPDNFSLGE